MGLTITKSGPYFNGTNAPSNTTNMKFSQLRDTFRLNNPTGAISASELLRDIDTAIAQIQSYLTQQKTLRLHQLQSIQHQTGRYHNFKVQLNSMM